MAEFELSRHHFREGLALSLRARQLNPQVARVDGASSQTRRSNSAAMRQPSEPSSATEPAHPELASYAQSIYRELNGDSGGSARRDAAGGVGRRRGIAEDATFAETLLGRIRFEIGDYAAAESTWRGVLAAGPRPRRTRSSA